MMIIIVIIIINNDNSKNNNNNNNNSNITAYCQQNRYVRFAIYTDLFTSVFGLSDSNDVIRFE